MFLEAEKSFKIKATNTNIYINWHFHASLKCKIGTLKKLIKGTKFVSTCKLVKPLLGNEINYKQKIISWVKMIICSIFFLIDREFLQLAQEGIVETKNQ